MASEDFSAELLKLAARGDSLIAALKKYSVAVGKEESISPLSTTITLAASVIRCLADDLAKNGTELPLKAQFMKFLIGLCKENFDQVQFALDRAVSDTGILSSKLDLGGRHLRAGMDEAKARLWCALDAMRYLALRKAEQENTLNAEETLALTRLVDQVPYIHRGLESLEAEVKRTMGVDLNTSNKNEKAQGVEPVAGRGKIVRRYMDDIDARSISASHSFDEDQFIEMDEFYEAWVIRTVEGDARDSRRSWRFLGLRVTEHKKEPSFWEVSPQLRSQEELKDRVEDLYADILKSGRSKYVKDIVTTLPARVREEIEYLIEDRERATSNTHFKREWQVVDVEETEKKQKLLSKTWISKRKTCEPTAWTIIIRGQSNDEKERRRPQRYGDPWRKPHTELLRVESPIILPTSPARAPVVSGMGRSRYNASPTRPSMDIHEIDSKIKESLIGN